MNLIFESFPGKNNFCAHWIAQIPKNFMEIIARREDSKFFKAAFFPAVLFCFEA